MTSKRLLSAPTDYSLVELAFDSGQHGFLVAYRGADLCHVRTEAEARRMIEAHQFGLRHGLTDGHAPLRFRPAA